MDCGIPNMILGVCNGSCEYVKIANSTLSLMLWPENLYCLEVSYVEELKWDLSG